MHREEALLQLLEDRIATLREIYRTDRSAFTTETISFLRSVRTISSRLQQFIDIQQEVQEVDTAEGYESTARTLTAISHDLKLCAVGKRVSKEIRQLHENLPRIQACQTAREQTRVNSRLLRLEESAPHCRRGHLMVVRKGPSGYFWGCSEFPHCMAAKRIDVTWLQHRAGNRQT